MSVITRFAPSPTGFLHIGGARTALFNWLFSRHHGGQFLLRIEDTDRARSTEPAVAAIYEGLKWLGLDWDGEPVSQFAGRQRHAEVAEAMLAQNHAYRCYCTQEELEAMRQRARAEGLPMRYDGRCRDRDPADAPPGVPPVVRLRAPRTGETVLRDLVQGAVVTQNEQIDDMVLLRSDGTPTYMLAVVVDDHDMSVSHVIRGADHLTNTPRQLQIYNAMGWTPPAFAHIPLIHGPDGAKLSKRHGALGVESYREMGYLPEAMRNYLVRLGWSHGDEEVFSTEQAIAWFNLESVGRSPARFDFAKLESLNGHYLRSAEDERLLALLQPALSQRAGGPLSKPHEDRLLRAMPGLKERAKTLVELADNAWFLVAPRPLVLDERAAKLLTEESRGHLAALAQALEAVDPWEPEPLEAAVQAFAAAQGLKLGRVAQPLRAALTGRTVSPGIFEVLAALGRDETVARIRDACNPPAAA